MWGGFVLLSNLRGRGFQRQDYRREMMMFVMQHRHNSNETTLPRAGLLAWRWHTLYCHAGDSQFKSQSWFFMPQIRKEVKKHCRLCLQIRGRKYICYNHRYFCWKVWTKFSENKSGSFLQWCYRVTGPCSKRRKGATSCTAEANNRRTRQGLKGCVIKKKTHPSIKLP